MRGAIDLAVALGVVAACFVGFWLLTVLTGLPGYLRRERRRRRQGWYR